jgi:hypothetical protein
MNKDLKYEIPQDNPPSTNSEIAKDSKHKIKQGSSPSTDSEIAKDSKHEIKQGSPPSTDSEDGILKPLQRLTITDTDEKSRSFFPPIPHINLNTTPRVRTTPPQPLTINFIPKSERKKKKRRVFTKNITNLVTVPLQKKNNLQVFSEPPQRKKSIRRIASTSPSSSSNMSSSSSSSGYSSSSSNLFHTPSAPLSTSTTPKKSPPIGELSDEKRTEEVKAKIKPGG